MYYINDQVLDLNSIKITDPATGRVTYQYGTDQIKKLIANAWQELDERYFNKGEKLVFRTPGIRAAGSVKGNMGYSYPRSVSVKTNKGKVTVRWCEDVVEEEGRKVYKPVSRRIGQEQRTLHLSADDIEEAIWMYLFNPHIVKPGNPIGRTFLEDKEADAAKYAELETKNSVVAYWLYYESSPFYADEIRLDTIGLAWGENIEGKSIPYKKQKIAEAVKHGEKQGNPEYNMKAFDDVCRKMADGQDVRNVELMALIQRCIGRKVIRLDDQEFQWNIMAEDGRTKMKTICKVPPQAMTQARAILRQHLLANPDDANILRSALADEPMPSKFEKVTLEKALPPPGEINEEFIRSEMSFNDMKKLWQYFGYDWHEATKVKCIPVLIEKLILNSIEVPHDVKVK